jgi:oxygen-independent coproporphyrinogen III oxidase
MGEWLSEQDCINPKESTFEINPEDLLDQPNLSNTVRSAGFNRISLGIQTLSPKGLKVLERQTDAIGVIEALSLLEFPPESLSLDFILGWPGQTQLDIEGDLQFISDFKPGHISAYLLNLEPGTRMTKKIEQNQLTLSEDDTIGQHWDFFRESLISLGYLNYEISSFSLSGRQSQHNRSTWRGSPYLGLGSGAVSRVGKTRWTNHSKPRDYLEAINNERWPVQSAEYTGKDVAWKEALLLGCRHDEGLSLEQFASHFSNPLPDAFYASWKSAIHSGDLRSSTDRLCFQPEGWARFDAWISDWMLILDGHE